MLRLALVLIMAGLAAHSQTFEVASVKVSAPGTTRGAGGGPGTSDPGQYHSLGRPLRDLITTAYGLEYYFQISSPTPVDRDLFDVTAKVPAETTRGEFRAMLRNLLVERFHLRAHKESRDFPALELTVSKGGPKLKESALDSAAQPAAGRTKVSADGFPQLAPDQKGLASRYAYTDGFIVVRMAAQMETVSRLASALRIAMGTVQGPNNGTPVIDHTGLTGKYDFRFEYSQEVLVPAGVEPKIAPVADLFQALPKQLGLQLTLTRLPFDVWVIDAFDKTPVEN